MPRLFQWVWPFPPTLFQVRYRSIANVLYAVADSVDAMVVAGFDVRESDHICAGL